MKAMLIGGGHACEAIIELASGTMLKELSLDVECVVDPDLKAPGVILARSLGIATFTDMMDAFQTPGLEVII